MNMANLRNSAEKRVRGRMPSEVHGSADRQKLRDYQQNALLEKALATFGPRPYPERYQTRYHVANLGGYLCQAAGAALAFTFCYHTAQQFTPSLGGNPLGGTPLGGLAPYVSALAAGLFLLGLEAAKRDFISSFIKSWLQSKAALAGLRIAWPLLLLNGLLLSLSVFTSYRGAEQLAEAQADRSAIILNQQTQQADSLRAAYTAAIRAEEQALASFKESVTYMGRINIHNAAVRGKVQAHTHEIAQLKTELRTALAQLSAQTKVLLATNSSSTQQAALYVIWLSLLLEVSGLACIAYRYYFLHNCLVLAESAQLNVATASASQSIQPNPVAASANMPFRPAASPMTAPVGFALQQNAEHATAAPSPTQSPPATLAPGQRRCAHCQTVFTYKIHNQKYCSSQCRKTAWEIRNGRTLRQVPQTAPTS